MRNELRFGRFTSSKIGDLLTVGRDKTTFGKPAQTYIKIKGMERRLGRSIDAENSARPVQWGTCCEDVCFQKIGTQYTIVSDETIVHKDYDFWSGSPDLIRTQPLATLVADIKCPQTLKSFCTFVDSYKSGGMTEVRAEHDDGEGYYWQLVSNAILLEKLHGNEIKEAELIAYVPYMKDLNMVRDSAEKMGYAWIQHAFDCDLPYLIEGNHYKDVNVLSFEIPQADKDLLTSKVLEAEKLLTS